MKKIVKFYSLALLLCAFAGGSVSYAYHHRWLYYVLLIFPVVIGWRVLANVFRKINNKNLKKVTIITAISFVVMIGALVVAAYYQVDEKSFWGMGFAVTIFSYMIGIVLIGLTLPKRWEEKRKLEKKFPYWKLKSTSYWCRFFCFFDYYLISIYHLILSNLGFHDSLSSPRLNDVITSL